MKRFFCIAMALCLTAAAPKEPAFDWHVGLELKSNECVMANAFEGPGETKVSLFGGDMDKAMVMFIDNELWNAVDRQKYAAVIQLDAARYEVTGVGGQAGKDNGIAFALPPGMLADLQRANVMRIEINGQLADELSLRGTRQAVAMFANCMLNARIGPPKPEPAPTPHGNIPLDPFAH